MNKKIALTKAFLQTANIEDTDQTIKEKLIEWWWNVRDKDLGGLRLRDEGLDFIENVAKIKVYKIKIPDHLTITAQVLIWLDHQLENPYHITKKHITVLSEKDAFELYLFSGDVKKMGAAKAMAKRRNSELT